jgi:creatinine amidohydrolase
VVNKYKYEEMFPDEFLQAIEKCPVFFIPTGLLEWHGDHLPLGQDSMKAYGICLRSAEKLGGGIVLPANYIGRPGYSSFTGTLTYSEALVNLLFTEMFGQLKKVGAQVIVLVTGHYGPLQVDCVKRAAENFTKENPQISIIAGPEYEDVDVDGHVPADHAGLWETSMFWHFYPDLVRMDRLNDTPEPMKIYNSPPNDYYKESSDWSWSNPVADSSPELGKKAVDIIAENYAKKIHSLLNDKRDEQE